MEEPCSETTHENNNISARQRNRSVIVVLQIVGEMKIGANCIDDWSTTSAT